MKLNLNRTWCLVVLMAVAVSLGSSRAAFAGGDWNESGIAWKSYDDGLALAKKNKKPICLIFYTEWCPHCANYSKVFHDPKVIEKSKSFVMVHLDKDKNVELSGKYKPDGEYIPRTFFLSSKGELDPELNTGRDKYKYFYGENDPASILGGMDKALAKLK